MKVKTREIEITLSVIVDPDHCTGDDLIQDINKMMPDDFPGTYQARVVKEEITEAEV